MSKEVLEKLDFYIKDPGQYAAEWSHETKRKVVAVFPNYFPVELLDAAGLLPLGLWGSSIPISMADSHMPPFVCSLLKSNLEMLLEGQLKAVDGAVFAEICDAAQNSESVWRSIKPESFTTRYRLTKNPSSEAARDYMIAENKRIAQELRDAFKVELDELDIVESIIRRNAMRKKARALMDLFYSGTIALHPLDFYVALRASHVMDPDQWIPAADAVMSSPPGVSFGGTRIFLSGMTCEPMWLLDELDRVDFIIGGDDIAFSWRAHANDVSDQGDPYEALADYTLSLHPCANLHHGVHSRSKHILKRVKESNAKGVIFTRLKFCDPEAFDHPHLKKALDEAGIPSLLIETELSATDVGTVRTRIEAFAEQLEGGGAQ